MHMHSAVRATVHTCAQNKALPLESGADLEANKKIIIFLFKCGRNAKNGINILSSNFKRDAESISEAQLKTFDKWETSWESLDDEKT